MPTCSQACKMIPLTSNKAVYTKVQRLENEENLPIISPRAPSNSYMFYIRVDDIV